LSRAEELVKQAGCGLAVADFQSAVANPQVQVIFISTLNSTLTPIALAAVRHGKHVLVEKPAAVCVAELDRLESAAKQSGALVRVGYNHRFHPAALKAVELFRGGALGPMMFVRGRYGQGGRVGYEKEWRADPSLSGGGELIDQGVHLIDLAGIFLGEFTTVEGHATTYFWNMPVDDNAFSACAMPPATRRGFRSVALNGRTFSAWKFMGATPSCTGKAWAEAMASSD